MIGNWQHQQASEPRRYLDYAFANLRASADVCARMISNDKEQTWANASVVLFLEAHAVELFLKGAILSVKPNIRFGGQQGHDLNSLSDLYDQEFSDQKFKFYVPFKDEYLGFTADEIDALKNEHKGESPSMLFRYPVKSSQQEWPGIHGFDPSISLESLRSLQSDFERISNLLTIP